MDISIPFSQLNEFLLCGKYCGKCHGIRSRLGKEGSSLGTSLVVNEIDKSVREAELSSE